MIRFFALISCAFVTAAAAQDADPIPSPDIWLADKTGIFDANSINIDELVWIARPVIVFADSPNDPRFRQQMDLLADRPEFLAERDVLIVTDTDPAARSDVRMRLRPHGFMLVLIGKDGEIELRKPAPLDVRELTRSIDKMPLRQQEIEDRRTVQ